ncbi:hypothetical protein GQ55_4G119900 [Panicum hallii var. hallii]|uniref:Uncharacterized protein n=1 Tax=Panicum hallii var. hallii TaxID=1504633 RepID=A0A2T7DXT4_9POAL|nr:hypothetical protein GQ55_4G119900 [Panicum hallii var. hallii]
MFGPVPTRIQVKPGPCPLILFRSYPAFQSSRSRTAEAIGMASGRTGGGAIGVLCPLYRAT